MKDNQKIYLDKVVEFLVRDTIINYDKDEIQFPFFLSSYSLFFPHFSSVLLPSFNSDRFQTLDFSDYCKNVYGLTEQEIGYVWNQYRTIILDKISNK